VAQSVACLQSGLAVLVEKPASLSLEDVRTLSLEAARLALPVSVAQNFRFLPRERGVRKALADDFGPALNAVVVSARPAYVAAPHLADVPHGPLWDICLHHVDALRVRFGSTPESAEMSVGARAPGLPPGDRYTIDLRWRDGPAVLYVHSEGAPAFHHAEWIEGQERAIAVSDQRVSVARPGRRPQRVRVPRGPEPERAVLDDFLATLQGRSDSSLSIADNVGTVAVMQALLQSEATRRPVAVAAAEPESGAADV
jgi:predicted dehydrogenase